MLNILPPSLEKQTPAQMMAFAKKSEKRDPDFWRAVAQAAHACGDTRNETAANAICIRLERYVIAW